MEKYGIKKAVELKNNKIYARKRYNEPISEIIAEFLVREYIFEVIEELFSNDIIDVYESNDLIIKIISGLTKYDVAPVIGHLKNKILYFANKEYEINFDGLMIFCLNEFKYKLCKAIEECLYEI